MAQIARHPFKLVGGHPALDFINTVHDWNVSEPHDYLSEFAEAIRFGKAAGLLTRADGLRLRPQTARIELARLRQLRALLKRIFQKRVCGQAPSDMDLRRLSADLAEVARATRLIAASRTRQSSQIPVIREISAENAGDALLRFRIVEAAAALLVSGALPRVKSCPTCGWFFLDVSKNRSRRWCSMDACGSVAKARRYYRRWKDRASRALA